MRPLLLSLAAQGVARLSARTWETAAQACHLLTESAEGKGRQAMGAMRFVSSHSSARDLLYSALLAQPDAAWNVQTLIAALPTGKRRRVCPHAVRANLYLLLDRDLLELVNGERVLTLRLTAKGAKELAEIVAAWRECGLGVAS